MFVFQRGFLDLFPITVNPFYRLTNAAFQIDPRTPAQFAPRFGRIHQVGGVLPQSLRTYFHHRLIVQGGQVAHFFYQFANGNAAPVAYYDMLKILQRKVRLIPSNEENGFRPQMADYDVDPVDSTTKVLLLKSNPCNPTGVTVSGEALQDLVQAFSKPGRGALFDEAYEFYCDPEPESALRYIDNIDDTDIFVIGAATKGLQVPGMRIGWAVAAQKHIKIFRNYSSFGMGGVSRASQLYVTKLFDPLRVQQARAAVSSFFASQRERYETGLRELGFELFTGNGGFYHWGKLPNGLTADAFNERLFKHHAGILPGRLCDMARRDSGPLDHFMRFSFGPLGPDSYDDDIAILSRCV